LNTVNLAKNLKKIKIFTFRSKWSFKGDIIQNHEQKKSEKKVNDQDSMGKTNFLLSTLPFSPWAVLATWLHVGAPQKI
jgi:hypothetical protein